MGSRLVTMNITGEGSRAMATTIVPRDVHRHPGARCGSVKGADPGTGQQRRSMS